MFLRGLLKDKKTKLSYSNGLRKLHLSSLFSDGGNRTAHKTCLNLSINYQETQKNARSYFPFPKRLKQELFSNQ